MTLLIIVTSYIINSLVLSVGYNNLESKSQLLFLFESFLSTSMKGHLFLSLEALLLILPVFQIIIYEGQGIK